MSGVILLGEANHLTELARRHWENLIAYRHERIPGADGAIYERKTIRRPDGWGSAGRTWGKPAAHDQCARRLAAHKLCIKGARP